MLSNQLCSTTHSQSDNFNKFKAHISHTCIHCSVDDQLLEYLKPRMSSREFITEEYLDDDNWKLTDSNIWFKKQSRNPNNEELQVKIMESSDFPLKFSKYTKDSSIQVLKDKQLSLSDLKKTIATIYVARYKFEVPGAEKVYADVVYNETIDKYMVFVGAVTTNKEFPAGFHPSLKPTNSKIIYFLESDYKSKYDELVEKKFVQSYAHIFYDYDLFTVISWRNV